MNADEARNLTEKSLKGTVIDKFTAFINMRIQRQAKSGKSSVHNPQVGDAKEGFDFYLNTDESKAVRLFYENKGFVWREHQDPDPGNPVSRPYTTLSW